MDWIDSLAGEYATTNIEDNVDEIRKYWDNAHQEVFWKNLHLLYINLLLVLLHIILKEDWFFDKERSMLDKRIIAIAPVSKFKYTEPETPDQYQLGPMVVYNNGVEVIASSNAQGI